MYKNNMREREGVKEEKGEEKGEEGEKGEQHLCPKKALGHCDVRITLDQRAGCWDLIQVPVILLKFGSFLIDIN